MTPLPTAWKGAQRHRSSGSLNADAVADSRRRNCCDRSSTVGTFSEVAATVLSVRLIMLSQLFSCTPCCSCRYLDASPIG